MPSMFGLSLELLSDCHAARLGLAQSRGATERKEVVLIRAHPRANTLRCTRLTGRAVAPRLSVPANAENKKASGFPEALKVAITYSSAFPRNQHGQRRVKV